MGARLSWWLGRPCCPRPHSERPTSWVGLQGRSASASLSVSPPQGKGPPALCPGRAQAGGQLEGAGGPSSSPQDQEAGGTGELGRGSGHRRGRG